MPYFGNRSKRNLERCEKQLQDLFNEVIKHFDCSVLCGHRTLEEQFSLYKKGRKKVNGKWEVANKHKVVTWCDGTENISKHNKYPSQAVDVIPYPIDFEDTDRMYMFIGFVKGLAISMNISILSGADWNSDTQVKDQKFHDLPHFELIN